MITKSEQAELQLQRYKTMTPTDMDTLQEEELFPKFVEKHLRLQSEHKKKDVRKLMALIYITYLMRFKKAPKKSLDSEEEIATHLYNAPLVVQERFLEEFTEVEEGESTQRRMISSKNKDKLISYILVLSLFVEDFQLDPSLITADLQENTTKINDHLRALGCEMTNTKEGRQAALKAPLKFPKPRLFKRT